eukprot:2340557-Ditylum_brightwellii.AAC.1
MGTSVRPTSAVQPSRGNFLPSRSAGTRLIGRRGALGKRASSCTAVARAGGTGAVRQAVEQPKVGLDIESN